MSEQNCPACSRPTTIIYVHGHAQCQHCKNNIMPCCQGSTITVTMECGTTKTMPMVGPEPCPVCFEPHKPGGVCKEDGCPNQSL